MTNAFIQGNGNTTDYGTTNAPALAYTSNVTNGNLLVTAFRHSTGATVNSITDNLADGHSWTIVYDTNLTTGVFGGWAWKISGATAACIVTMNLSASVNGNILALAEWNGPTGVRATVAGNVQLAQANPTSSAITATSTDLLVGVTTVQTKFPAGPGAGSGYVIRVAQTDGAFGVFTVIEDNLNAAGGSTTASFTGADTAAGTASVTGIGAFITTQSSTGSGTFNPSSAALLSQLHQLNKL